MTDSIPSLLRTHYIWKHKFPTIMLSQKIGLRFSHPLSYYIYAITWSTLEILKVRRTHKEVQFFKPPSVHLFLKSFVYRIVTLKTTYSWKYRLKGIYLWTRSWFLIKTLLAFTRETIKSSSQNKHPELTFGRNKPHLNEQPRKEGQQLYFSPRWQKTSSLY